MFARVLPLRKMGVLASDQPPAHDTWAFGIFEFKRERGSGRRLVLRDARANPDKGIIFELYRPELIDVTIHCLRFRGVESVPLSSEVRGAMVQDWLVLISSA